MEPIDGGWGTYLYSAASSQLGNIKNAISNLYFAPVEDVKSELAKSNLNKPSTFDLDSEIKNLKEKVGHALTEGSDGEVKASLVTFARNVYRSVKDKDDVNVKMAAIEAYVNTVLDVVDNNPKIAHFVFEHLLSRFSVDENLIFVLLNNPRFNIHALNEQQANTVLRAGVDMVFNFVSLTPDIHDNICELVKLTKTSGKDLEDIIEKSIAALNVEFAESLIEINDGKLPNKEAVMDRAIEEQDSNLVGLIVKFSDQADKDEFIKKCVDGNVDKFLEDILPIIDQTLTESQISDFSKQAHLQGNLSLMKSINPKWKEVALSEFKNIPEELKPNKLTQYFLNSNKNEVNELTLLLKSNGLISDTLLSEADKFNSTAGKLISRFPNPMHQQEVYKAYGKNYENYEQQQQGYGKEHLQLVNKAIEEIRNAPAKSLESVYLTMINSTEKNPWRMGIGQTPILTRYAIFKKLAVEKLDNNYQNPHVSKTSINSFNISMPSDKNSSFKLTTIASTSSNYEPALQFYHSKPIFEMNVPIDQRPSPRWFDQIGISED